MAVTNFEPSQVARTILSSTGDSVEFSASIFTEVQGVEKEVSTGSWGSVAGVFNPGLPTGNTDDISVESVRRNERGFIGIYRYDADPEVAILQKPRESPVALSQDRML